MTDIIYICKTDDFPGTSVASEMPLLVTTDIKLVDPSTEQVGSFQWWDQDPILKHSDIVNDNYYLNFLWSGHRCWVEVHRGRRQGEIDLFLRVLFHSPRMERDIILNRFSSLSSKPGEGGSQQWHRDSHPFCLVWDRRLQESRGLCRRLGERHSS